MPGPLSARREPAPEPPFREELLGPDRLAVEARRIAAGQRTAEAAHLRGTPLLSLVARAAADLVSDHARLTRAANGPRAVSPAGEWLLDNYYLIEQQIREIREDLPVRYGVELPRLASGAFQGLPRIYEAVVAIIARTDSRLDVGALHGFIEAYQEVSPLTIGECWAVPIMLRVGIVENLRRLSRNVLQSHLDEDYADSWADRFTLAEQNDPDSLPELLARIGVDERHDSPVFLLRLAQRLQGAEVSADVVNSWLAGRLSTLSINLEREGVRNQQRQAADQVSIANAIASVRLLNALDWTDFFEGISYVERVLRRDPADAYAAMDFPSRDRYRHALEEMCKRSRVGEIEAAEAVVARCRAALSADPEDEVRGHVGYWLISAGFYDLEREVGYRLHLRERLFRGPLRMRRTFYWSLMALSTALFAVGLVAYARWQGVMGWPLAGLVLLALMPLSDMGSALTNRVAAAVFPPRPLPKFDESAPVADAHRTVVIVPSLLLSVRSVAAIIDSMEVAYLANRDPNIHFVLLGDPKSSDAEHAPDDDRLAEAARKGVEELNQRYEAEVGERPFHLMLRGRAFSRSERTWMGWERKRGFIDEFVWELRNGPGSTIHTRVGDDEWLSGVTYVLSVDADTVVPRDAVKRLICTIAHPLNRARWKPGEGRVSAGYGLIQPRVGMSLPGAHRSRFSLMYSSGTGIDPYASAVSDTYQDLFAEGSFTGKGIFEVDVFLGVLHGAFPENSLLSHDLIEGCFLRTALASDIEVIDDHPANYLSNSKRLHRWVRGDWQTLPLLRRRLRTEDGSLVRNPLSALHRWKVVDNLRRSLVAPLTLLLFTLGWLALPHRALGWMLLLPLVVLFPAYFSLADSVISRSRSVSLRSQAPEMTRDFLRDSVRGVFEFAVLPHQAYLMLDAIGRTLWRMGVSRRHLLEWVTAAEAEQRAGRTLADFWRALGPSSIAAVVLLVAGAATEPARLWAAAVVAVVWLAGPVAAWWVSEPTAPARDELTESQHRALRRAARKTWRFFDTFVTARGHHLVPDNFQEEPDGRVAWRTSPTNMGLQLLAYLNAYDLGYVSLADLSARVEATLATMAGMDRHGGHFYNWYDVETLTPMRPAYVSTVDSGNLAGHLLTLRVGLLEATEAPLLAEQLIAGAHDAVALAIEDLDAERDGLGPDAAVRGLHESLDAFERAFSEAEAPADLGGWSALLERLSLHAAAVEARTAALEGREDAGPAAVAGGRTHEAGGGSVATGFGTPGADTSLWPANPLGRVRASCADAVGAVRSPAGMLRDLAPWAGLLSRAPAEARGRAELRPLLSFVPSVVGLAEGLDRALLALDELAGNAVSDETRVWAEQVGRGIRDGRGVCTGLLGRTRLAADIAREMWEHTDFAVLFDESRLLFSIGYNLTEGRLDDSTYDLLASEARLASFLAVAKGDVPQAHWFRLGRQLTDAGTGRALVSWSGSMFEYLMPLLVMSSWPGTILDETYSTVVRRQRQYAADRGVPWGISESGFNAQDAEATYQYQAFGVPGLGLKRGLGEDVVVAPYAAMLALPIDACAVVADLEALAAEGAEGRFGFYEAIDYTAGRVPAGERRAVVRAYFAHHQGMAFVALGNELTGEKMRRRFHSDPMAASAELLLQERVPRGVEVFAPRTDEVAFVRPVNEVAVPVARLYRTADTPAPSTRFLSNGRYSVMVTNGGGGYSRWRGLSVTRYREDVTRDCWGTFFYVRDLASGEVFSVPHNPWPKHPDEYRVAFSSDKAEFRRIDGDLETSIEVAVSPEDDVEVRRLTFTNRGHTRRDLEVTSYLEIAMSDQRDDQAHRSFSNLFVETEALPDTDALLFSRRPRNAEERRSWGLHMIACDDATCEPSFETDRAAFLGRLRGPDRPVALESSGPLGGGVGAVLDPCASIRGNLRIGPDESARVVFITGAADSRDRAMRLAEKYHDPASAQRAINLAWTSSQVELRDLGISPEEAIALERLASRLLLTEPYSPLKVQTPTENELPVSGLWSLGISGDYPILLVRVEELEHAPLVRRVLLAHQYWRHKGLLVDLVVLNTKPTGYGDEFDDRLRLLMRTGHALQLLDKPGGIFLRRSDQMHPDVLNLLVSAARAVLEGGGGSIELQLDRRRRPPAIPAPFVASRAPVLDLGRSEARPRLLFDNGIGGFDPETGDYVIELAQGANTPASWINVMASREFGCLVSEAGVGCTWALNSHENRITTWNNDLVSDGTGETFYLRDEETGEFWSPTPMPARAPGTYSVRHAPGCTTFRHASHGVESELEWFVAADEPVRVVKVRLVNTTDRPRRLTLTHFIEWALGSSRSGAQQRVVTRFDAEADMLTAHNWFNQDFPGRPAFLACDRPLHSWTASRTEFVGRNGRPADPAAMHRRSLGGASGRFHDNCGALMVELELQPHAESETVFLLGQAESVERARELVAEFREKGAASDALAVARERWEDLLSVVQVETPDPALDLMLNRWLLYQVLSCRVLGRTAAYQSSGAFGFRDQLQDVLALLIADPQVARRQIVEASHRQFPEGDVLHWWQPLSGRGVRTHMTDDRLWLPYVVAEYLRATGDHGVLDEMAPFLEGQPLAPDQEDAYVQPLPSQEAVDVYEHCVRAIECSLATGQHGLPLMGGGDWNDGMNRVGHEGRGESVWLAWFTGAVLTSFAPIVEARGDSDRAARYREAAASLARAAEAGGWDGAWYLRAFFDDGTPLGTKDATECRIDGITQAWATISGLGDPQRSREALEAVQERLVRREDGLIALLAPPFDTMPKDPGYIKGYLPGVRENGGQYTHAAVWVVLAHLLQGDGDEAFDLLSMLNPISHASEPEAAARYKVEPYSLAADVYTVEPHVGRGGWTWYTGAAAWMYRVAIGNLLGLTVENRRGADVLVVDPCIPKDWPAYSMTLRHGGGVWHVRVENPRGVNRGVERVTLDGQPVEGASVPLDGAGEHEVVVTLLGG
jgi:cyclic beta-1,2-glucan synthetase